MAWATLTVQAYAVEWQEYWTKAIANCQEENYVQAELYFNLAIQELEISADTSHPYVYVDRARVYFILDRFQEAVVDVDKAIKSKKLIGQDLERAVITRMMANTKLGNNQAALDDLAFYKKVNPNYPKLEFFDDKIIIRNMPECECYRKMMKAYLLAAFCEKEEDITIYDSNICIAKIKPVKCQAYNGAKASNANNEKSKPSNPVDECKWWCDKMALAGMTWCAGAFKKWHCQAICVAAVEGLKDGCHWCCSSGNFVDTCIKPFSDIVSRMGERCDPGYD